MKLASRLQFAAALVIALAVAACAYYWLFLEESYQRLRAGTMLQVEQQSAQLATGVSQQMAILVDLIDVSTIYLCDALNTHDRGTFRDAARRIQGRFPNGAVMQIGVVDRDGYFIYVTDERAERPYGGDREYFTAHLADKSDRLFIAHPQQGHLTERWSIPFSRPIIRQGNFVGVVVLSIDPRYIAETLMLPEPSANNIFSVIYADGAFLSRSNRLDEALGNSIPPNRPFIGANAPSSGTVHSVSVVDGIRRTYSWRRLKDFPLVVNVGLAEAPILAPIEQSVAEARQRAQIVIVFILALATGIAVLLRRVDRDAQTQADSERFLESIVENLPAMIFVKDAADLRFVKFNKAGEELLGYSQTELIGRNDYDFFPKEEADIFTAKDREVLAAS